MVAGAIAGGLDLTTSRRLNLAAAAHATPLVLLRTTRRRGHERRRHALAHRRRAGRTRPLRRLRATRDGTWRWSAAATAVPVSGLSSGTMSRIVSVWLKAWPIARLLQAQASAAPADAPM